MIFKRKTVFILYIKVKRFDYEYAREKNMLILVY